MGIASNLYDEVVLVYINLVRQDSPQAAEAIEKIASTFGTQAALRAALIITIFRMERKQNRWLPDTSVYMYLIQAFPQAVPLLEYALGCCLQAWHIPTFQLADLIPNDPPIVAASLLD